MCFKHLEVKTLIQPIRIQNSVKRYNTVESLLRETNIFQ